MTTGEVAELRKEVHDLSDKVDRISEDMPDATAARNQVVMWRWIVAYWSR